MLLLGAFFHLTVVIKNSAPNNNKFNFLDSTANYSANFDDQKVIPSLFDAENIFLLKNIKKSIFFIENHLIGRKLTRPLKCLLLLGTLPV